jgi:glycosyltransferase involved in cell wall biosynthesis
MPKVSIIIPVYNVEKYLPKCLDSVCNQTLKDIEVICINDASQDSSLSILQGYSIKDSRVKIVDLKENRGPSNARNEGLRLASGEFIGFLDSDDYIDDNFYESLYLKAVETDSEVVKGGNLKNYYPNGDVKVDMINSKIKESKFNFNCQFTTAIFSNNLLTDNNIKFPDDMAVYEDPVFVIKASYFANKIEFVDSVTYHRISRDDSSTRVKWDDKKLEDFLKYIDFVNDFYKNKDLSNSNRILVCSGLANHLLLMREIKSKENKDMYNKYTKKYMSQVVMLNKLKRKLS